MFRPDTYRNACDGLRLGAEKIEEMIDMTENENKRTVRRPLRVAVIAAAMVAALGVTASAAQLPAVQDLIITVKSAFFVSGNNEDGSFVAMKLPEVSLDTEGGKTVLTVDGETVDCTDELAKNGEYTYHKDLGDSSFDVVVKADGTYTITGYDANGEQVVNYAAEAWVHPGDPKYSVTITGEDGQIVPQEDGANTSTYTVTADDVSSVEVDG